MIIIGSSSRFPKEGGSYLIIRNIFVSSFCFSLQSTAPLQNGVRGQVVRLAVAEEHNIAPGSVYTIEKFPLKLKSTVEM